MADSDSGYAVATQLSGGESPNLVEERQFVMERPLSAAARSLASTA